MTDDLQTWLAEHPSLAEPVQVRLPQREVEIWRDLPDSRCCHCCDGTGLVSVEAMRRFVNPDYDATMSPAVRCLRSSACGFEVRRWNDPETGPREQTSRRFEGRPEIVEVPVSVAERIHQALKAERRSVALAPDRSERNAAMRDQIRDQLGRVGRAFPE